jgi:hypothetical protein
MDLENAQAGQIALLLLNIGKANGWNQRTNDGEAVGLPVFNFVQQEQIEEYTKIIAACQYIDGPIEYILETNPQMMRSYLTDFMGYSKQKLRDSVNAKQLDSIPFPYKTTTKLERIKELYQFLEENPELRTTNPNILRQRIANHFLLQLQLHDDNPPEHLLELHIKKKLNIEDAQNETLI